MLCNSILILHNNIINTNNQPHALQINKVSLINLNNIAIKRISTHSRKSLHVLDPELGSAVEFKDRCCAWDTD